MYTIEFVVLKYAEAMNNYLTGAIIVVIFIIFIVAGNWFYWVAMPVEPATQSVSTSRT